ncbi:MAG TPA: restriction endonuclease subunit S [Acetivibrio thermocellus]|nr:restriction endonuclease subunit S [Acetivibrio thermocellus]
MREGYKKTELGEIPVEWEVNKLEKICEIIMGQSPKSSTFNENQEGIPFFQGKTEFGNIYPKVVKWCTEPTKIARPFDILLSVRAPVGDVNINNVKACIGRGLTAIRHTKNSDYRFIYYILIKFRSELEKLAQGSTFTAISTSNIKNLLIPIPPIQEQQKIADILFTVDELIEQTDVLIEKTKELKKGLMQRLLTKGIGHTDFKKTEIGEIPVEWEIHEFGSVIEKVVGGGTPSRKKREYFEGEIPWATVKDLDDEFYKYDTIEHITKEAINESAANIVDCNNIIIATRMGLGRGFINKVPMAINQDLKGIYPNRNMSVEFIMFWILFNGNKFEMMGKGSTVKGIRLEELRKILIPVPPLREQKEIASVLLSVDTTIDEYQTKKQKLQTLKQGLMQKLLTGKIRVKVS